MSNNSRANFKGLGSTLELYPLRVYDDTYMKSLEAMQREELMLKVEFCTQLRPEKVEKV